MGRRKFDTVRRRKKLTKQELREKLREPTVQERIAVFTGKLETNPRRIIIIKEDVKEKDKKDFVVLTENK